MLRTIRKIKHVLSFSAERIGDYAELLQIELALFKQGVVKTVISYVVMVVSMMMFLTFVSVAVLVTSWDTPYRVIVAWAITAVWFVLALISFYLARTALTPSPLGELGDEIRRDVAAIRESL
jgi:uncharacterized membrane protein YqjE